ncbi:TRAP transporter substrate-binding protein [Sedimentitalea sp. XS_ASV28]|uniref:TRAP transporter substrate-binding protein n=1 Tax=Sedimentitalea sp. XS_ASV28 TaxID=3241296 RepID=UPI0035176F1E
MKRRDILLRSATLPVVAASALATPALAQSSTKVRWRMPTSFPTGLATLYGGATFLAERVAALTDGAFEITPYAGGEIVPPLGVLEAAQNGTVEAGFTAGFYYLGKNPALMFDTGVPFGMSPRQHNAWISQGGGLEMMRELYAEFNVINFAAGNSGAQMGGWYRKPIDTLEDIKGLRIRAAGLVGSVFAELGAVPQSIPGSDLYPAMERGALDAVEFVGPYDDERLGFQKVAKYYYAPGVLELGASICLIANMDAYNELPETFKQVLQAASAEANTEMLARYDSLNIEALRRLIGSGVELRSWSEEIMLAMQAATQKLLDEEASKDARFKDIHDKWKAFRDDQILWSSVNDGAAQTFLAGNRG